MARSRATRNWDILSRFLSPVANYKNGNVQSVPYRVDGVAEDQVLDAAVPVRAHHEQIGLYLPRIADDFLLWIRPVANSRLDVDLHGAKRLDHTVEILAAGFDLRCGGLGA